MASKVLAIVGFILSFLLPIVGLILCAAAMGKMKQEGANEMYGLAVAGLVIGIIFTVITVLVLGSCVGCATCISCLGGMADYA